MTFLLIKSEFLIDFFYLKILLFKFGFSHWPNLDFSFIKCGFLSYILVIFDFLLTNFKFFSICFFTDQLWIFYWLRSVFYLFILAMSLTGIHFLLTKFYWSTVIFLLTKFEYFIYQIRFFLINFNIFAYEILFCYSTNLKFNG